MRVVKASVEVKIELVAEIHRHRIRKENVLTDGARNLIPRFEVDGIMLQLGELYGRFSFWGQRRKIFLSPRWASRADSCIARSALRALQGVRDVTELRSG